VVERTASARADKKLSEQTARDFVKLYRLYFTAEGSLSPVTTSACD
jgi:hypothetical protein